MSEKITVELSLEAARKQAPGCEEIREALEKHEGNAARRKELEIGTPWEVLAVKPGHWDIEFTDRDGKRTTSEYTYFTKTQARRMAAANHWRDAALAWEEADERRARSWRDVIESGKG